MNERKDEEIIAEIEKERAQGTDLEGFRPVNVRTTEPRAVFSVRLGRLETKKLSRAAERRGMAMGDFIRMAALEAAQRDAEAEESGEEVATLEDLKTKLEIAMTELNSLLAARSA